MGSKENVAMSYSAQKLNHNYFDSEKVSGEACLQDGGSLNTCTDRTSRADAR